MKSLDLVCGDSVKDDKRQKKIRRGNLLAAAYRSFLPLKSRGSIRAAGFRWIFKCFHYISEQIGGLFCAEEGDGRGMEFGLIGGFELYTRDFGKGEV